MTNEFLNPGDSINPRQSRKKGRQDKRRKKGNEKRLEKRAQRLDRKARRAALVYRPEMIRRAMLMLEHPAQGSIPNDLGSLVTRLYNQWRVASVKRLQDSIDSAAKRPSTLPPALDAWTAETAPAAAGSQQADSEEDLISALLGKKDRLAKVKERAQAEIKKVCQEFIARVDEADEFADNFEQQVAGEVLAHVTVLAKEAHEAMWTLLESTQYSINSLTGTFARGLEQPEILLQVTAQLNSLNEMVIAKIQTGLTAADATLSQAVEPKLEAIRAASSALVKRAAELTDDITIATLGPDPELQ